MAPTSPRAGVDQRRYHKHLKLLALAVLFVGCSALPKHVQPRPPETDAGLETININTASETELTALPGIGRGIAKRLILHRNKFGDFSTPAEIMLVEGIGEKQFQKVRNRIRVE